MKMLHQLVLGVIVLGSCAAGLYATNGNSKIQPKLSLSPKDPSRVSDWFVELAQARKRQIDELRNYLSSDRFPQNHDYPQASVPYFVDQKGSACAVAYLLIQSGYSELVEEIRKTNNHVRIGNVLQGPLIDWILFSGLTQEECALIQPTYRGPDGKLRGPGCRLNRPTEHERLAMHFRSVIAQLERDTPKSLALAFERLQPRIEKELVGRVVSR